LRLYAMGAQPQAPAAGGGHEDVPTAGPGTEHLRRRAARHLPDLGPLRSAVGEHVREERVELHRTPPLLGSVYHLVPAERLDAYGHRVEQAGTEMPRLRIRASGPWPPYSFGEEVPS